MMTLQEQADNIKRLKAAEMAAEVAYAKAKADLYALRQIAEDATQALSIALADLKRSILG